MKKNDRSVTIRIPNELYDEIVNMTIQESQKENRIIKISETIRTLLEKNIK